MLACVCNVEEGFVYMKIQIIQSDLQGLKTSSPSKQRLKITNEKNISETK